MKKEQEASLKQESHDNKFTIAVLCERIKKCIIILIAFYRIGKFQFLTERPLHEKI